MYYINVKYDREVETVDEFETFKEAKDTVIEYNLSDRSANYYISQRSTKEWRNK